MKRIIIIAGLMLSIVGMKAQNLCNLPNSTYATKSDLFLKEDSTCYIGTKSVTFQELFRQADSLHLIFGSPLLGDTTHISFGISIDTNNGGVIAYNYGTIGQALVSQGKGHPDVWRTISGGGGGSTPAIVLLGDYTVNLNPPTDSLILSANSGTWQIGDQISGSLSGTTAQVYEINNTYSPPVLYLINVVSAGGFESGDVITGSVSGAIGTVSSDGYQTWSLDTALAFNDGKSHIITDLVYDSVSVPLNNVTHCYIYSQPFQVGNNISFESGMPGTLQSIYNYENTAVQVTGFSSAQYVTVLSYFLATPVFYFTISTPEGTTAFCKMKIYGYK